MCNELGFAFNEGKLNYIILEINVVNVVLIFKLLEKDIGSRVFQRFLVYDKYCTK